MKKTWQKPNLIILVRSNPEEAVLSGCKGNVTGDPNNSASNCASDIGNGRCSDCSAQGTS